MTMMDHDLLFCVFFLFLYFLTFHFALSERILAHACLPFVAS